MYFPVLLFQHVTNTALCARSEGKKKLWKCTVWHSWKWCIFRHISKSCQNSEHLSFSEANKQKTRNLLSKLIRNDFVNLLMNYLGKFQFSFTLLLYVFFFCSICTMLIMKFTALLILFPCRNKEHIKADFEPQRRNSKDLTNFRQ